MYAYHFVAFVPNTGSDLRLANEVFTAFGWGPDNLSRKVSDKANGALSHYLLACGLTEADYQSIKDILDRDLLVKGITAEQKTAFKKLIYHVEPYGMRQPMDHVAEVMAANALTFVVEPLTAQAQPK